MKKNCIPLPEGVCVLRDAYQEVAAGTEVVFTFRGKDYAATVGVNAFAFIQDAPEALFDVKGVDFDGLHFDTAVVVFPAGVYTMPRKISIPLPAHRVTVIGENVGVSPNAKGLRRPNPAWKRECSVLQGKFYWGAFTVGEETPGLPVFDGLTMDFGVILDKRTKGKTGFTVQNCVFTGAYKRNTLQGELLEDAKSSRRVTVRDCRVDGLDSVDADGRFFDGCMTELTVERLYYAHTKKFLGFADYYRKQMNLPPRGKLRAIFKDCIFEDGCCERGFTLALPKDASVDFAAENCVFRNITAPGEPIFRLPMPNARCRLSLRRCKLEGRGDAAIRILEGKHGKVELNDTQIKGYGQTTEFLPPRRTKAPAQIGKTVWEKARLDDPHAPCKDTEEALRHLRLLYDGRSVRYGDMHNHSASGGTSDGDTPIPEFVRQLKEMGLDFTALVEHFQIRQAHLKEWDDDYLLIGTEPTMRLNDPTRPPRAQSLHYTMIFRQASDFYRVMEAFPEYEYTGGTDGRCFKPRMTPERLTELGEFIYSLGGTLAHAHPKERMASDDPLDFYFGDKCAIETVVNYAESYGTVQNVRLWEQLLKLGKRVYTRGMSDAHTCARNTALTSTYTQHHRAVEVLDAVRDGDCSAGCVGIQMAIGGTRMGGHRAWRKGLKLAVRLDDYYRPGMKENTVYCLKVWTDKGLAYASEFDGKLPQELVLPVEKRMYYRVEVTNESDGAYVAVSNPIWLD